MNINLIFPPLLSPSCVPIGIASLKAYIQRRLPKTNVRLVDLNLYFVDKMLNGKLNNLRQLCQACGIECALQNGKCLLQKELFQANREIFKKAKIIIQDKRLFFDQEIFEKYVGSCSQYIFSLNRCWTSILKRYVEQKLTLDKLIVSSFSDEISKIVAHKPRLIGFSILQSSQLVYALALAKMLKQKFDIPVILGGAALANYDLRELMLAFNFIDFVIIKEGEAAFVELLRKMKLKDFKTVPNLIWRTKSQIIFNALGPVINLNALPAPNFDGLALKSYFSPEIIIPLVTSRHCPWGRCKFCNLNAAYHGHYRVRAMRKVIADIRYLNKRYGAANFFLTDSEMSPKRLKDFSLALIKSKLKVHFACYIRPTQGVTFSLLRSFYKAGGRFLVAGVESLSDRCLQQIDKGINFKSIRAFFKNTCKLDIKILVYMMHQFPLQTKKELLADLQTISSLQRKYNIFSVILTHYQLSKHQRFYQELLDRGFKVRPGRPVFVTQKGQPVSCTDWLNFYRPGTPARLPAQSRQEGNAVDLAEQQLNALIGKFKLNEGRTGFIQCINNFLFETQLLYARKRGKSVKSLLARNAALKFYLEKRMEINYYLCKNKKSGLTP